MNQAETNAAISGITDDNIEGEKGYCQKYVRQVTEGVYGTKFGNYFTSTARESGENFLAAGTGDGFQAWAGDSAPAPEPGDLLYKTHGSGNVGHVGIYVGTVGGRDNLVASNSSTSIGRISGAKGYRTLDEFGHYDVLVRLTPVAVAPRLILAQEQEGSQWIYTAVESAQWETDHFTVNQSQIGGLLNVAGETVRQPVREAVTALGYVIMQEGDHLADTDARFYIFVQPATA